MLLLDTNVMSEPLRQAPEPRVIEWIDAQAMETLFLSSITMAELRAGVSVINPWQAKTFMKLITNRGADRVIDLVRPHLKAGIPLGCVTTMFSLFAYAELRDALAKLATDSLELLELKSQCGVEAKRTAFACHGT